MAKVKVKRFTDSDWDGLAGAEPFTDGTDPYISERGKWLLVADAGGLTAGNEDEWWYLPVTPMTPALGLAILTGLPADFDPETFGMIGDDR